MKVSRKWMQSTSNADISSISNEELVSKMGLQLGAIEETIDWGARYDKVVV